MGSTLALVVMVIIGGGSISCFFVGLVWAITDKVKEAKQKKNGTYDPNEPLWFMKEKPKKEKKAKKQVA